MLQYIKKAVESCSNVGSLIPFWNTEVSLFGAPPCNVSVCQHVFRVLSMTWASSRVLASFPGRRRNGLATFVSSNCIRMLRHGNCNISLQQTSACDTYNFSSCEKLSKGAFLLVEATVCCSFYY